jgi:hypothetical protein
LRRLGADRQRAETRERLFAAALDEIRRAGVTGGPLVSPYESASHRRVPPPLFPPLPGEP